MNLKVYMVEYGEFFKGSKGQVRRDFIMMVIIRRKVLKECVGNVKNMYKNKDCIIWKKKKSQGN